MLKSKLDLNESMNVITPYKVSLTLWVNFFLVKRVELVYSPKNIYEHVVKRILDDLMITYESINESCIILPTELPDNKRKVLVDALLQYSIKIVEKNNDNLVEQIKNCVRMVIASDTLRKRKLSTILSEKLGYSYPYLSSVFSNETFTSVENFYIFSRIEKAKEILMNGNKTLAEVAHKLDYSSVSHLSRQFKNVTGLTVSQYLRLLANRKGDLSN